MPFILIAVLLVLTLGAGQARIVIVPQENFSINLPDSWNSVPRLGTLLFAGDATHASAITIADFPNAENRGIEPGYINQVKQGIVRQGDGAGGSTQFNREGPLTLGNAPSYLIAGRTDLSASQSVFIRQYLIFANKKIYIIGLQTYNAAKIAELETIAQSFHFSSAPEIPLVVENTSPKTVDVPGEDLSLTLPAGWTAVPMEGNLFFAKDASYVSTVALKIYPNDENRSVAKKFIENLKLTSVPEAALLGATTQYTKEGSTVLDGVPAYFIQGKVTMDKTKESFTCEYAIAADNKLYVLSGQTGDAAKVSEVDAIINSVRFTHRPTLPVLAPEPSAYQRGYRAGQITFYVFFFGIALTIIIRIFWLRVLKKP